jgi:glycosyltransferase involved in cell wall biosynthesis
LTVQEILFSLFVPTRNRASTASVLIRHVLSFLPDDCEVVVQDCGTDDELPRQLANVMTDPRLRYEHAGKLVPMTENWNLGMRRCRGRYISIVGDDDGICMKIGQIARWAKANDIEALTWSDHPWARYYWPDFTPKERAGTYNMFRYSGAVRRYSAAERLARAVRVIGHMGDLRGLPHLYHGLVRRDFVERMQLRPGVYFDGVNPDVYAQYFLMTLVKEIWWVDYPGSTGGICAKSNSGAVTRKDKKELAAYYGEYDRVDWPILAPLAGDNLGYQAALEGMCRGLTNAGRGDLLQNLDVARYFAHAIFYDRPVAIRNLRRYFQASASLGGGPVAATKAMARACLQLASVRYLTSKRIDAVEEYGEPSLFTQFRGVQDIAQLLVLQQQALDEMKVRAPWDDHTGVTGAVSAAP